ncbi:nicotinate-nucleotide adenylyltransferase [Clostridium sp.]|uniref:nicotinate-nucleotide adenylyltransferase n=1 Tax=Clostridium sp. TaxID=1506 RepID=UPI0026174036|nr:nicotinate-nucleotide adenylyltransferase [Clostridium sp.]
MKRYGMMGGTFNPIHLAHLYIAYEAKETLNLDKVIFMVAGNPPHKKESSVIDSNYRYDMVKIAIKDYSDFEISDYEIQKQGYSYTYETLKYLKGDEGDVEVFFIAGADSLMDIEKWKNPELVLSNCTFVAFNRGEYNKETLEEQKKKLQDKYNSNIILLDISNLDISSSMIRERIIKGKRVDFFIPEKVMKYIEQNKLYKGD